MSVDAGGVDGVGINLLKSDVVVEVLSGALESL
jgi:hypothetical protein